jgi:hypothetical protein
MISNKIVSLQNVAHLFLVQMLNDIFAVKLAPVLPINIYTLEKTESPSFQKNNLIELYLLNGINKDLLSLKGAVPHIVSKKVDHRAKC